MWQYGIKKNIIANKLICMFIIKYVVTLDVKQGCHMHITNAFIELRCIFKVITNYYSLHDYLKTK